MHVILKSNFSGDDEVNHYVFKKPFIFFKQSLDNRRGSSTALALIMAFVGLISLTTVGTAISHMWNIQKKTVEFVRIRQALDSSLDYTVLAIKQNWCMTSKWTKEISEPCNLKNDYNLQRLMLSDTTLKFIEMSGMPTPEPVSKTRLKKIGPVVVTLADIQSGHPLFKVLVEAQKLGATSISFTVERVDEILSPSRGREIPIKISVEVNAGIGVFLGRDKIESLIYFFPRELGTNALILANDLYLDASTHDEMTSNGDSRIRMDTAKATSGGLRFDSPVFVNNNLYLPNAENRKISNVTFADKVILGGGYVYQKVGSSYEAFSPNSAGGFGDQFNSEMKNFGGLLRGVELDPEYDQGLRVLSGIRNENPDMSFFNLCKARQQAKSDLTFTRESQSWIKVESIGTNLVKGAINLGKINQFIPQQIDAKYESTSSDFSFKEKSNAGDPVMRVWVNLLNYGDSGESVNLTGEISRSGQFTIVHQKSNEDGAAEKDFYIKIQTESFSLGDNVQDNAVKFNVEYGNLDGLKLGLNAPTAEGIVNRAVIELKFEPFDLGYANGVSTRSFSDNRNPTNFNEQKNEPSDTAHYLLKKQKQVSLSFIKPNTGSIQLNKNSTDEQYFSCSERSTTGCQNLGYINFEKQVREYATGTTIDDEPPTTSCSASAFSHIACEMDLVRIDFLCNGAPPNPEDDLDSFDATSWETSFAPYSKHAWSFAGLGSPTNDTEGYYDGTANIETTKTNASFKIHSLVKHCLVKSTANFVTGFFNCEKFTIEERSQPLRIIATVITNKLVIHPSAITNGIYWSSIYNVNSIQELRDSKILKEGGMTADQSGTYTADSVNCDDPEQPLWAPYPSLLVARKLYACNPVILRAKADPFTWTSVDPDCGPLEGTGITACKKHVTRWQNKEIYRRVE